MMQMTKLPNVTSLVTKTTLSTLMMAIFTLPSIQANAAASAKTMTDRNVAARFMSTISNDGLVAVVNESPILKSDLRNGIRVLAAQYKKAGEALPSASQLQTEALNDLIMRQLQLSLVKRAGVRPTDAAINAQLSQYAKSQGVSSIAALQKKMDAQEIGSYAELRSNIIDDLAMQAVRQNQVSKRVKINAQDIQSFLSSPEGENLNQNEYQTIHIRVPYPSDYNELNSNQKQVSQRNALELATKIQNELKLLNNNSNESILPLIAGIQGDYPERIQGGNMGYHPVDSLPSNVASKIVNLNINQVTEPVISPSGVDVIKLVNKKVSGNLIIPQWRTRHILISVNDFQSDQMAKLKINDLYEQLRQGVDFAKLAATYSDDPGSAGKGGDLDWVSEGSMVPQFETVMKNTETGDFSVPFKSQYGWHILQVIDNRNFDASNEVRENMAKEILYRRMAPQAQEDWLQELKSKAYIRIYN